MPSAAPVTGAGALLDRNAEADGRGLTGQDAPPHFSSRADPDGDVDGAVGQ